MIPTAEYFRKEYFLLLFSFMSSMFHTILYSDDLVNLGSLVFLPLIFLYTDWRASELFPLDGADQYQQQRD